MVKLSNDYHKIKLIVFVCRLPCLEVLQYIQPLRQLVVHTIFKFRFIVVSYWYDETLRVSYKSVDVQIQGVFSPDGIHDYTWFVC